MTRTHTDSFRERRKRAEEKARIDEEMNLETLTLDDARELFHELRVYQIELEMQNEELRNTKKQLEDSRSRYFALYDLAPVGYLTLIEHGRIRKANLAAATMLGMTRSELNKQAISRFIFTDDQDIYYLLHKQCDESSAPQVSEMRMVRSNGTVFWASMQASPAHQDELLVTFEDITRRKQTEAYLKMGREVLQILNEPGHLCDSIQRVLDLLKMGTGFDAVGIRLQDGDDFPYIVQSGFPGEFVRAENSLVRCDADGEVCRDADGNVCLECTCGLVISGRVDPANPLFSPGGSFWTNDSAALLTLPSDRDSRLHPRNHCIHDGYASFALIPIRNQNRIVGLIQFCDRRRGCFTLDMVELLEDVVSHIGAAVMRKRAEDALREQEERNRETLQKALRESEDRFRQLFEQSEDAIVLISPQDYAIIDVNPTAELVFRTERAELLKKGLPVFCGSDGHNLLTFTLDQILRENSPSTIDQLECLLAPGELHYLSFHGKLISLQGSEIIYTTFRDITIRVLLEQQSSEIQSRLIQANRMTSLGTMVSSVAHEINNPNNFLLMNAEILKQAWDDIAPIVDAHFKNNGNFTVAKSSWDEARTFLPDAIEGMRQGAHRISSIVGNLKSFGRDDHFARESEADVNAVVQLSVSILSYLISRLTCAFRLELADGLPLARGSARQLEQVVINLIQNALLALPDPEHGVLVATGLDPENGHVLIRVTDEGSGIAPEIAGRVMEPFFTTRLEQGGTGLGLAISSSIVKEHGGSIEFTSEPGKGTTFTVRLRQAAHDEDSNSPADT